MVKVTIGYQKPGTQPPIFVAGSWSQPPWQPVPMDYVAVNSEYLFTKIVHVSAGEEIQYKFRIGHGDWWALQEDADKGKHSSPRCVTFNPFTLGEMVHD